MHICFICSNVRPYPVGGLGAVVAELAQGLIAAGHAVTIAGIYPSNWGLKRDVTEWIDGARVVRLTSAPAWMRWRPGMIWDRLRLRRRLAQIHRQHPFDLVEAGDGDGWLIWGAFGCPIHVKIHGSVTLFDRLLGNRVDPFVRWLEQQALSRADHVTGVSSFAIASAGEIFALAEGSLPVIYNAVDAELFCPDDSTAPEEGLVLFVNGIEPRKGVEQLVAAMAIVAEIHPTARLALIGGDSGPRREGLSYQTWLEGRIEPALRSRIEFLGRVPRSGQLVAHLRRAAVCCYPSQVETFGMAPVEAMAVGRPVIYMQHGPGPEVIEHGHSGLLCDTSDPADIADKILTVLRDRDLAEKLGRNARQTVLTRFDKNRWVQENILLYQKWTEHRSKSETAAP